MGSPTIFAGSRTKLLSSAGLLNKDNSINDNNGLVNYIKNGHAEVSTVGWATYALSEAVTFQDTGDTVTLNSHGLQNNQTVSFSVITSTTGISINTLYYVVNATTNTFQVATSVGGSALALTTNGSGTLLRGVPVNGTGGSANVTWTQSTTSPLDGTGSFVFTKDAANRMGQGASYAFTIDSASQAKVLNITFDYIVGSGTFAAGTSTTNSDLIIYLYDVTNSVLYQPTTVNLFSNSSTIAAQFVSAFQTPYNSTSYRLIIHCATVSASAYTVKFDNVCVCPSNYTYGSPVTDLQSYTPSFGAGFGTVTNIKVFYQQVGDSLRIFGTCTLGTTSAAIGSISLPSGLSIDTNKITIGNTTSGAGCEVGKYFNNGGVSQFGALVTATGTSTILLYMAPVTTASGMLVPTSSVSTYMSSNAVFSFDALVPILGWSSSVQMSDSTSQAVIAASYWVSSNFAASTTVPINFDSKDFDVPGNGVTTSATAWKFTAAVPGVYSVGMFTNIAGSTTCNFLIYKNGSSYKSLCYSISGAPTGATTELYLNANDYIDIRPSTAATVIGGALTATGVCNIAIQRVSGPQTIAANTRVFAQYYMSSNQATTANVTVLNLDSRLYDSHGSVTTGASPNWRFTAPRPGTYTFTFKAKATAAFGMNFYKNGSVLDFMLVGRTAADPYSWSGTFYLNAGDYCYFISDSNVTIYGSASPAYGTIFSVVGY